MTLDRASLLLNMLLILVSVGAHQAGAGEFAFLLLTVAVCVAVWLNEKRGRPLRLGDRLATAICLIAFAALMWRTVASAASLGRITDVSVAPVGDFLIVFQWVTLCRSRKGHDYFWMYLITLVHMGTAGLEMPGLVYGFFFIAYAFTAICALAVGHAASEARAAGAAPPGTAPWRVRRRFYLGAQEGMPPVLAAVAMLFIVLPRTAATSRIAPAILRMGAQPTSGFSEVVQLGAVGQVQDNPTRVMHVIVRDPKTHESIQVPWLLLRGLPLDTYVHDDSGWSWRLAAARGGSSVRWPARESPRLGYIYERNFPGYEEAPYREITCDISLERLDTPLLFVPFAPETFSSNANFVVAANNRTQALQIGSYNRARLAYPLNYTVTSRLFDTAPPPKPPARTVPEAVLLPYLTLPPELSPRIRALALQIAPASARTDYQKAMRVLDYLSSSSRFTYTTNLTPTRGVEPVEDFLFNLKRGHCEYFAASMVVLLREVNVPARLVNGFKVSEWNEISSSYIVRQENAHSWVEAYLRPYGWRTLDPTAASREAATPKPTFVRRIGADIYDWIESLWVINVLNFDSTDQSGVYGAARGIAGWVQRWAGAPFADAVSWLESWEFGPVQAGGALNGMLTAALWLVAILVSIALAWAIARAVLRMVAARARPRGASRQLKFYGRMERLLARRGFRRAGAQTPREFSAALAERNWPAAAEVAAITDRFCRARYGALPPTAADLREIEQALRAIKRARRPSSGA